MHTIILYAVSISLFIVVILLFVKLNKLEKTFAESLVLTSNMFKEVDKILDKHNKRINKAIERSPKSLLKSYVNQQHTIKAICNSCDAYEELFKVILTTINYNAKTTNKHFNDLFNRIIQIKQQCRRLK